MKTSSLFLFAFLLCFSCNGERLQMHKELKMLRKIELDIDYPIKAFSIDSGYYSIYPENRFQIVTYIDGTCPLCLNELGLWEEYILNHQGSVDFFLFVNTKSIDDLKFFLQKIDFRLDVIPVFDNDFQFRNIIPKYEGLNTFLMENSRNVIIVGNPIKVKAIDNLVQKAISRT